MSGKLLQAVWAYRGSDLDCTETHILARMAWYASDAGGDIFPSIATLCLETKLGRSQMFERIKSLKNKGFIVPEGTSGIKTKRYRISLEKLGVENEFNHMSSIVPPATRPETGPSPVRKPDSTRPETGHNRLDKNYIEKHNDDLKKKNEQRDKASQKPTRERLKALTHEETMLYEQLCKLPGMLKPTALGIVENFTLAQIRNVIESAQHSNAKNVGGYIVSSLFRNVQNAN